LSGNSSSTTSTTGVRPVTVATWAWASPERVSVLTSEPSRKRPKKAALAAASALAIDRSGRYRA